MEDPKKSGPEGLTRRDALKISGLALGGLAIGGALTGAVKGKAQAATCDNCCPEPEPPCSWYNPDKTNYDAVPPNYASSQKYSYFETLEHFYPYSNTSTTVAKLGADQMRITFMGSMIPPVRRAQQEMSVFVEVGWNSTTNMPLDQFVFDCGAGVCANYGAMNVGYGRMDKVFVAHLHGDHMSDLTHIYCFGPSADRKSPLYVWGPGTSGVKNPLARPGGVAPMYYDDGTNAFCQHLRAACRWHSESFSFQTTRYTGYPTQAEIQREWGLPCHPTPVGDDQWGDAYAMVPIQLDWTKYGKVSGDNVAYFNQGAGVKITHFPVIHCRKGSIGYKLQWWPPGKDMNDPAQAISMIYTSDTKPEIRCRDQAINGGNGVDVLIHEMIVPPNIWAMKGLDVANPTYGPEPPPESTNPYVQQMAMVQNSSHSPQGAFGCLLSQINPQPRLTVATHFPVADDTISCAMNSVQEHFPNRTVYQGNNAPNDAVRITWSFDLMVITVDKRQIVEQCGYVTDFGFSPWANLPTDQKAYPPKYHDANMQGDPYAQIDTSTAIPPCDCTVEPNQCNYRDDGY
jgi:ribonuclease Z